MNNLNCSFELINVQPELVVKSILGSNSKEAIKNALLLSTTSKLFHKIINSHPFFEAFVTLMGSDYLLPQLNSMEGSNCFKLKYFDLRNLYLKNNETFPGTVFGDAFVDEQGVEVVSFFNGIYSFKLIENLKFNPIVIPENMRVEPRVQWRTSPFVARSRDYLAINDRSDSCVYIFKPDGKECLAKFEVAGELSQIAIVGNYLCTVSLGDTLNVFNLERPEEEPFKLTLPGNDQYPSICFGKEYFIYSETYLEENKLFALPLSCLQKSKSKELPWLLLTSDKGTQYLFPLENDFIEVTFTGKFVCDISKISIENECIKKTPMAKDIVISEDSKAWRTDVCFHDGRLVVAYEDMSETKLFSYDLLSEKLVKLPSIPAYASNCPFSPRFLCMAEKIYYLLMSFNPGALQSNLSTFTFSKI